MYKKLKFIKMILSTILISLFIINIFKSCSFAFTNKEVEDFAQNCAEWQINFNGRDNNNDLCKINTFFNNNYWESEKENNPFENYDSVIIRYFVSNSKITIEFICWNYTQINVNFSCTSRIATSSIIDGDEVYIRPVSLINNLHDIRYTSVNTINYNPLENNFTKTENDTMQLDSTNSNIKNTNCLFMMKNTILNRQGIKILGFNIYNQINASNRVVNGITKMADVYIGEYYTTGTISYRLYYTKLGQRVYLNWDYNDVYQNQLYYNQAVGELYSLNIIDEIETDTAYIEAIYNDNYVIATSNRFHLQVIKQNNAENDNSAIQYNQSGEPIGYIDLSNMTNVIISGDQKIIEQLQQNESGEKSRFDYWVGFFNPSGDNISNQVLNESGDIFGISYRNIDNYGIFDFIHNIFDSIYALLFNNTTNVSLNMGMFGNLNSADFTINNSAINTFISSILNPTLIIITLFFYYRFIKLLATLDLSVLEKFDVDNNINLF